MGLRGRVLALAAITLGALVLSAPATSADGDAKSKITIEKLSSTGAAGKVASGRATCLRDRKVNLFVLEDFIADKLEVTETNANGKWRITRRLTEGPTSPK